MTTVQLVPAVLCLTILATLAARRLWRAAVLLYGLEIVDVPPEHRRLVLSTVRPVERWIVLGLAWIAGWVIQIVLPSALLRENRARLDEALQQREAQAVARRAQEARQQVFREAVASRSLSGGDTRQP